MYLFCIEIPFGESLLLRISILEIVLMANLELWVLN